MNIQNQVLVFYNTKIRQKDQMCHDILGKRTTKRDLTDQLNYIQKIHWKCPNASDKCWLKNDIFEYITLNVVDDYSQNATTLS